MIKFFRKIRQNLLSEGKTGKYLKYAFGEIILVMIGILLALQVNSWNQKRLDRIEEKKILRSLKQDFKNSVEEFETLNLIRRDLILAATEIFKLSPETVDEYSQTHLDSLFSKTLSGPTFNNKSGSLNVLLTSGKINLISNIALKEILIEWPGDVADMIEDEVNQDELYKGRYLDMLGKYVSWNDLVKVFTFPRARFEKVTIETLPDAPFVTSDYSALLADMEFLNVLNRRATTCIITNQETEMLIEKAKEVIQMIDFEIK
ncbi:DUF6090 family protein [Eudoraea chungangensis]|uniref:DUF6090 family protein n=1 Tax=Eudoraea chungangensis TaxID=1481905 RepID=UPI0023EDD829|nr:DUF6090 family protein [Eudoraea chungangensis]